MNMLGDRLQPWFERALDLSSRRHELLAANVANVDTPDFVPRDLEFRDALRRELASDATAATATNLLAAEERPLGRPRLDGGQVDLDQEVTRLASNRTFHELATEVMSRRIALMRYSIDEGGR